MYDAVMFAFSYVWMWIPEGNASTGHVGGGGALAHCHGLCVLSQVAPAAQSVSWWQPLMHVWLDVLHTLPCPGPPHCASLVHGAPSGSGPPGGAHTHGDPEVSHTLPEGQSLSPWQPEMHCPAVAPVLEQTVPVPVAP
jgi:hypothetical protein